jgi:hypothetical protein
MNTYKKVITLVKSTDGDWEGLYLDNELYCENHSLRIEDVFDIINDHDVSEAKSFEVYYEWLNMVGSLPNKLNEIPEQEKVQ